MYFYNLSQETDMMICREKQIFLWNQGEVVKDATINNLEFEVNEDQSFTSDPVCVTSPPTLSEGFMLIRELSRRIPAACYRR